MLNFYVYRDNVLLLKVLIDHVIKNDKICITFINYSITFNSIFHKFLYMHRNLTVTENYNKNRYMFRDLLGGDGWRGKSACTQWEHHRQWVFLCKTGSDPGRHNLYHFLCSSKQTGVLAPRGASTPVLRAFRDFWIFQKDVAFSITRSLPFIFPASPTTPVRRGRSMPLSVRFSIYDDSWKSCAVAACDSTRDYFLQLHEARRLRKTAW